MKNLYKIALTTIGLLASQLSSAQWTDVINNNINFRVQAAAHHYNGDNDFDGQSDPSMRTEYWFSFTNTWGTPQCYTWDCSASCTVGGGNVWTAWENAPFNSQMQIWLRAFESDNSNECTYTSGDDHFWEGNATLRDGQVQMPIVYQSTDFYPGAWNGWLGSNGSQWLYQGVSAWDQRQELLWRYSAGDDINTPLNFGTISPGQSKSDVNSNRQPTADSYLKYSNTTGQQSADVWYQFTLSQSSTVTITTAHSNTNFDTRIDLFSSSGQFIEYDYDDGGNLTSLITRTLCAGTYKFSVEGYQNYSGVFKVSVSAGSAVSALDAGVSFTGNSCPGEFDGYAEWNPSGGVSPYTWTWQGTAIPGTSMSGLNTGNFSLVITDACGNSDTEIISIEVDDATDPVAQCVSNISLSVSQGNSAFLSANEVDNGSSDNCEIDSYTLSQSTYTTSHVGTNTVTLTVTDASGNADDCTTQVTVVNTTGIEEEELLESMSVYPNPNTGVFNLDLTGADIQDNARISIIDASGREIYSSAVNKSNIEIDLGTTASGFYLLRLTNDGITASKRISIQ